MVQINQQVPPTHPDGWHFVDNGVVLKAKDYAELLYRVTEYRISQRRSWQGVQAEINEYLANVSPTTVLSSLQSATTPAKAEITFGDRVFNWLAQTYDRVSHDVTFVPPPEAERRASICAGCNYNAVYHQGCGSCVSQMSRMSKGIARNRKVSIDHKLHACGRLGMELAVAVQISEPLLDPVVKDDMLPAMCWRKAP